MGAPCIIVLEGLQMIAPSQTTSNTSRLASTLAHCIDALDAPVVLLATCDSLGAVHRSLLRAGRFGLPLVLRPPSAAQRSLILQAMLPGVSLNEQDMQRVAVATAGYVAADLYGLAVDAV